MSTETRYNDEFDIQEEQDAIEPATFLRFVELCDFKKKKKCCKKYKKKGKSNCRNCPKL